MKNSVNERILIFWGVVCIVLLPNYLKYIADTLSQQPKQACECRMVTEYKLDEAKGQCVNETRTINYCKNIN